MAATRSASTDKASAQKAVNMQLFHMVQLSLLQASVQLSMAHCSKLLQDVLDIIIIMCFSITVYNCTSIIPRFLSFLILRFKDQIMRPILLHNLCCQWRQSLTIVKVSIIT